MSYKKYLLEYEEKTATVHSDQLKSTDDVMYSNARALELYGQGKRFNIEDNVTLYEIVKIVREIVDKHFYYIPVQFYIQIADREAHFTFIIDKVDIKFSYFVETLFMFITTQIYRIYGNYFVVERTQENKENNKVEMTVIVKKSETEKE